MEEKIDNLTIKIKLLEEDIEVIKEFIEQNTGFYGFAELWLKYYPTDLFHFFPKEVNEISKYFEKVLKKRGKNNEKIL